MINRAFLLSAGRVALELRFQVVLKPRGHRKPVASVGARGTFKAEPSMGWMALLGWLTWSRRMWLIPEGPEMSPFYKVYSVL